MIRRARHLLQLVLLIQAILAVVIGLAFEYWLDLAPWSAALLGLGSVALMRLLINSNNFLLSSWTSSPTPPAFRLGVKAQLAMMAEEFVASMRMTSCSMPFARPHIRIYPGCAMLPVLLVHGYGCNSGYWRAMVRRLDRAHISHATLDLEPLLGDIDSYAPQIEAAVNALCGQARSAQVTIVAHSMGALAARAWIRSYGSARLWHLISIGSPHHGTCMAAFGLGVNGAQMRRHGVKGPACDWLRALAASEDANTRARITSVYSHHDNIVTPQTTSELDGARNLALGGIGHVALGSNQRVLDVVFQELKRLHEAGARHSAGSARATT